MGCTGAMDEAWMACSTDASIGLSWRGDLIELWSRFDGCLELGDGVQYNQRLYCCCSETLPTSVIQTLHCGLSFTLSHVNITRIEAVNRRTKRFPLLRYATLRATRYNSQLHPLRIRGYTSSSSPAVQVAFRPHPPTHQPKNPPCSVVQHHPKTIPLPPKNSPNNPSNRPIISLTPFLSSVNNPAKIG